MRFKTWLLENTIKIPTPYKKWGVGKSIGGKVYIHKKYEENIPSDELEAAKKLLPSTFQYNLLAYELKTGNITFTWSSDFDSSHEPIVGDQILVKKDGSTKFIKQLADPWIYHHKYLWVKPSYKGFDYKESQERSKQWLQLDVNKSKIGKLSYWREKILSKIF